MTFVNNDLRCFELNTKYQNLKCTVPNFPYWEPNEEREVWQSPINMEEQERVVCGHDADIIFYGSDDRVKQNQFQGICAKCWDEIAKEDDYPSYQEIFKGAKMKTIESIECRKSKPWIPKEYELPDLIEAIEAGREVQPVLFRVPSELEEIRQRKDKR